MKKRVEYFSKETALLYLFNEFFKNVKVTTILTDDGAWGGQVIIENDFDHEARHDAEYYKFLADCSEKIYKEKMKEKENENTENV